jgi:hypothetical protein
VAAHETLIDPNLKNAPPDFLDGEKVLVEGCGLTVLAGAIWRARRGTEKQRHRTYINAAAAYAVKWSFFQGRYPSLGRK